ncbi:MAG: Omp28 family outer membrane lipoprotein [Bacteroidaceae bacterium]|nr:Omp28 family outer membrane lipoprotein [Bacteroidaceae bacterium]
MRRPLYILHHTFYIALIALAALCVTACTGIALEDRLIHEKLPDSRRAVLIEDFTGQRCINCPNAADKIAQLKKEYGDSAIIAVGIHSGPLAVFSRGKILGLRTEEGDTYYEHWGVQEEPTGYINRTGSISTIDKWDEMVRTAVQQPSPIELILICDYQEAGRKADITVQALSNEHLNAKLQLWITESDITAQQAMPDGSNNPNYVHQHVFRASVNGTWGTDITLPEAETILQDFTATIPDDWKPEHLAVVAFIYNSAGVLQVTEKALIP